MSLSLSPDESESESESVSLSLSLSLIESESEHAPVGFGLGSPRRLRRRVVRCGAHLGPGGRGLKMLLGQGFASSVKGVGGVEVQCGEFRGLETAVSAAQAAQRDAGMRAPADPALTLLGTVAFLRACAGRASKTTARG